MNELTLKIGDKKYAGKELCLAMIKDMPPLIELNEKLINGDVSTIMQCIYLFYGVEASDTNLRFVAKNYVLCIQAITQWIEKYFTQESVPSSKAMTH